MITRDIHFRRPTSEIALKQLDMAITFAKSKNEKILEIITGYGSTSGSSIIKDKSLIRLNDLKKENKIKDFICGNHLDIFNPIYQEFPYKHLINKEELIKRNLGSIFIIL